MEAENSVARSSSCREASFEINSAKTHISDEGETTNKSRNLWLSLSFRRSSFQLFPVPQPLQRSFSRPSNHFCDVEGFEDGEEGVDDDGNEQGVRLEDIELAQMEKKELAAHVDQKKMKKKRNSRLSIILLDQGLFTVYKRLFIFSLAVNCAAIAIAGAGKFEYGRQKPAVLSMANILALTLCRSEPFLRLVFSLAVSVLGRPAVPLVVKTSVTSLLQSVGGVHSGCGVASIAWLAYSVWHAVKDWEEDNGRVLVVNVAGMTILVLLLTSAIAAFPLIRHLHHNYFELAHRFAGWAALALLWVFVLLTNPSPNFLQQPELWLTIFITTFTILPWLTVRRVPVTVSIPSGQHAALIKFSGGVSPGLLGRISRSPLLEWHAFGIISDGKDTHMMLAGAVGDFTRRLVADPPRLLWVRSVYFAGLPYLVNMYERVLLVATGSGLCVFLSFLLQPCKADVHLVWVAKGIEENYGKDVLDMVGRYPKEKVVVHDTAVAGRPNVAEMSVTAARRWGVEVVVVTSNPEGSRDVVRACRDVGLPAFGPIWDS